jgi:hypothetical protein
MNPFNKNPFTNKNSNTHIVGNKIQFDEKQKLENIKENMTKLKYQNEEQKLNNQQLKQPNLQEKIDFLRKIDK